MIEDLICYNCKHLRKLSGGCAAFPEGIPASIVETGESSHSKPLPNQKNKIVFEKYENEDEQLN